MTTRGRLYSLDTSSIISAHSRYYRASSFPNLWKNIDGLIEQRRIVMSEEVWHEAQKRDDVAAAWIEPRRDAMLVPTDSRVAAEVRQILDPYELLVKDMKNRNRADPFVIAVAKLKKATVVTEEDGLGSVNRPKIPGICNALGLDCGTFSDIIEWEGWTF